MANEQISSMPAVTAPHSADLIYLVDSTNVSQSAQGTSSQISLSNFLTYLNANLAPSANKTGTGELVLQTSPTLITPVLGDATVTSINELSISTSTGTLTIANSKTATINNTITFAGTDSTTMTFPSTSASIARTDAAQTFTGSQTFSQVLTSSNAIEAVSNAATVPITSRINTVTNNSAATLTITMTTASAIDGQLSMVRILDFSGVAQSISWENTENSTITAPTTSNGSVTLPLTVGFQFNTNTTKWRCIASA